MSRVSRALGYWSALGIVVSFAVFTVCFVAIPLTAPFYLWTDLTSYLAYRKEHGQVFRPNRHRGRALAGEAGNGRAGAS